MEYKRLPFGQYFINTSEDYNKTGRKTFDIIYDSISYCYGGLAKALGLRHEVNYEIHYEPERNVIQLNFQRTVGFTDWFANIVEFSSKYYDAIDFEGSPLQLRVHHGWGNMYRSIKRDVRARWSALHEQYPDAETEIIGWSLGSGQAILCCQDLNYNFGLKPHLITFGSVRPFKSKKADSVRMKRYLDSQCVECWNFADINDIVTYMPPFRGFMMIRRVEIGKRERRSLFRLLRPFKYHTRYDDFSLYSDFSGGGTERKKELSVKES